MNTAASLNIVNLYTYETQRLTLRPFSPHDIDHLFQLDSDPAVMKYINGGIPCTLEHLRDEVMPRILGYQKKYEHFGLRAAIERSSSRFIGWFHFRPPHSYERAQQGDIELGYRLMQHAWGHGYATEGSLAMIRKGFEALDVPRVIAFALRDNRASTRVMEKCGLRLVDEFEDDSIHEGVPAVMYAITREQWFASHERTP